MKKIIILFIMLTLFNCSETNIIDTFAVDPELYGYPINFSWKGIDTNHDGIMENYVTSVKTQYCNDCYIYAALGLLEMQYQIDHGIQINLNLSEQNIRNCLKIPCSSGGDDRIILEYIRKYGVVEESFSTIGSWRYCENCDPSSIVKNVSFFTFESWYTIIDMFLNPETDVKTIRRAIVKEIQTGPLTLHVSSWLGLSRDGNTLYCSEENPSGHIVTVVGYIDHGRALIIKNSHGGGELLNLFIDEENKCEIGYLINKIKPNTTRTEWGLGERFCYSEEDFDKDSVPDVHDNCPLRVNKDQINIDGDLFGDECDECPGEVDPSGFYCKIKK